MGPNSSGANTVWASASIMYIYMCVHTRGRGQIIVTLSSVGIYNSTLRKEKMKGGMHEINNTIGHTHTVQAVQTRFSHQLCHTVKGDEPALANRLYPGDTGERREKQM